MRVPVVRCHEENNHCGLAWPVEIDSPSAFKLVLLVIIEGRDMRSIELEIDRLVGYAIVGSGEKRIKKLGSAKLGCKLGTAPSEELTKSADRANAAA